MPAERTVAHKIDLAPANSYRAKGDAAIAYLLDAETIAPQLVRQSAAVRETVKALYRRGTGLTKTLATHGPGRALSSHLMATIGVVASAAGGIEQLRKGLIEPLVEDGHTVAVTLTPTAASWLDRSGESDEIASLTGLPVRSTPRFPDEDSPHPAVDLYVAAPWSAGSTAKLALGIADNQALTALCEAIATVPMVVFPRINAAHARQPAWGDHMERRRMIGVHLVYGDNVRPLAEPRASGLRELPWAAILSVARTHSGCGR